MDKVTLKRYKYLQKKIERIKEDIVQIEAGMVGSLNIGDMPKSNSYINDRVMEIIVKMESLQEILADQLNEALALKIRIERCLVVLAEDEQNLIRYRYLDGMGWNKVTECLYGDKADFSDRFDSYLRTVYNHHEDILQKIKSI